MSYINDLQIAGDISPEEILKIFFTGINFQPEIYHMVTTREVTGAKGPHFTADTWTFSAPAFFVEHLKESVGFVPTVTMVFSLDKYYPNSHEIETNIIRGTLALLKQTSWDMVLEFHDSTISMLLRRAGRLFLNDSKELWTPERLKLIDMDYEFKQILPIG